MVPEIIFFVKPFLIFLLKETQTQTFSYPLNKWLGNTGILGNTVSYITCPCILEDCSKYLGPIKTHLPTMFWNTQIDFFIIRNQSCNLMPIEEEQKSHFHSFLSLGAVLQSTGLHCQPTPATHFRGHTLELLCLDIYATLQAPALLFHLPFDHTEPSKLVNCFLPAS